MQNVDKWKETKFSLKKGKLIANRDYVSKGSLLMADLIAEKLEHGINEFAKGELLDLGCGTVPLYSFYKDKVNSITCIDWEDSVHQNIHLDMALDISKPLPVENDSFDTIILTDVLEHIPYPLELMNEIKRILKENGVLIMTTPFTYWEHEVPFDFNRYTRYMYDKLAQDSGLTLIINEPIGDELGVICDVFGKGANAFGNKIIKVGLKIIANLLEKFVRKRYSKGKFFKTKQPLGFYVVMKKEK